MRKLVVLEFMTLDGVIQAPGGPEEDTSDSFGFGGWIVPYGDEVLGKVMSDQMNLPFCLLLGRKTYDIFASYWPQHESGWLGINEVPKYVASRHAITPEWNNTTLLADNVVKQISELKTEAGPNLHVYGSGNFAQTLFKYDLVDELWLKIFPITLGQGKRLFDTGTVPAAFRLTYSKISPNGIFVANYERAGEVKTGSFAD